MNIFGMGFNCDLARLDYRVWLFCEFFEFCSRSEKFDKVSVCGIFQYGFLFADSWSRILAGDLCLFMVSSFDHSGLSQDLFLYHDGICSAGPSGIFSAAGDYSK